MTGYDFSTGSTFTSALPPLGQETKLAILCVPEDVNSLMKTLGWDKDTVEECENIDETIRYTNYEGYDFISLIYAETGDGTLSQQEINVFFSKQYIAAVIPANTGAALSMLAKGLEQAIQSAESRKEPLVYLYYYIFDKLTEDYSNALELLEDEMDALFINIERSPNKEQSQEISRLRKMAYTYKKLLRSLSYIGGQIVMDENNLLDNDKSRYFRNIDIRLVKLFNFADSLNDLSNQLLQTLDSKSSAQMNETINKLTIITLFFGPITAIAGIYGMNFVNMPELNWKFGYPAALGLMLLISVVIFVILKIKKWI